MQGRLPFPRVAEYSYLQTWSTSSPILKNNNPSLFFFFFLFLSYFFPASLVQFHFKGNQIVTNHFLQLSHKYLRHRFLISANTWTLPLLRWLSLQCAKLHFTVKCHVRCLGSGIQNGCKPNSLHISYCSCYTSICTFLLSFWTCLGASAGIYQ